MPVARAGCYAPGGRHPLPSSVLMSVIPARVAGVPGVQVASPRPDDVTLAAAALAGADRVVGIGGAQVIAALAYGTESVERCDLVAGPGNKWVSAAKKQVYGDVGIDMIAGPSELVVLADGSADPELVAADLVAQAEHDPDARPILVATDEAMARAVQAALPRHVAALPESAAAVAGAALGASAAALCEGLDEAVALCNRIAPEHLEVMVAEPEALLPGLECYGALFVGAGSAEVFGDYGVGPNHILPTGGGGALRRRPLGAHLPARRDLDGARLTRALRRRHRGAGASGGARGPRPGGGAPPGALPGALMPPAKAVLVALDGTGGATREREGPARSPPRALQESA